MNTPQLDLVSQMMGGGKSGYTSQHHTMLSQALGKPILNTPATAVQPDPNKPTIHLPGGMALQPNATDTGFNHVIARNDLNGGETRKVPFVGTGVKYQYDVLATRSGVNFGTLGYVLGALDELYNNYSAPLALIPSNAGTGKTVTVGFDASGNLVFKYTDGVNSDYITLSCSQMSMANLLQKLQIKRFHIPTTRCSFSDSNNAETQFSTSILNYKRKDSGGVATDPLSYIANQTPYQLLQNKVDVNKDYYLSREEAFMGAMIADDKAVLTHSLMMEEAVMYNIHS